MVCRSIRILIDFRYMIGFLEVLKSKQFRLPLGLSALILLGLGLRLDIFYIVAIAVGLGYLLWKSWQSLRMRKYSLDYIAILAMATSLGLKQFIAGAIISLMIVVSESLEEYGSARAEKTLKDLVERMPKNALVKEGESTKSVPLQEVRDGQVIVIRPKELIPLDGFLASAKGLVSEANLTGEMEPAVYAAGEFIKSGFVNLGETMELKVVGDFSQSAYQKIINLVRESGQNPTRIVRLAEKYNYWFTAVTLILSFGAYFVFHDWVRFLAVLVIATPCPLLIATPIAMIGGLNKAARQGIIIKKPVVIEYLNKVRTIFFDKTGTLTLGEPVLKKITVLDPTLEENRALTIAAAVEFHSIHPIARSIVKEKEKRKLPNLAATGVQEKIGEGIAGRVDGQVYTLKKTGSPTDGGIQIDLLAQGRILAKFIFDDQLKENVTQLFAYLKLHKYQFGILTGDKKENAERIFSSFQVPIYAESLPETKTQVVKAHQSKDSRVVLVGDGLNDAPALALADVGIVFSGTENSASIEAADIAILSHDVLLIREVIAIAQNSYNVALQSILVGIGLSILGMIIAFFGYIPPILGAVLQEGIDVLVIFNSLRATY